MQTVRSEEEACSFGASGEVLPLGLTAIVNNWHFSDRTLLVSEVYQILSSTGIRLNDQTGNYYIYIISFHTNHHQMW